MAYKVNRYRKNESETPIYKGYPLKVDSVNKICLTRFSPDFIHPRFARFSHFLSKKMGDKPQETSFFKTTKATNADPAAESSLSLEQTTQEIAVKLFSVEHDYRNGLSTMEQNRSQILQKLNYQVMTVKEMS
jgi:hypothetical protein